MNYEFKVGDEVFVSYGGNTPSLSGPFTIEKQHKGNGNVYVDGQQFTKFGYRASRSVSWTPVGLVLAGSEQHHRIAAKVRRATAEYELSRMSRLTIRNDADLDAVEAALKVIAAAMSEDRR